MALKFNESKGSAIKNTVDSVAFEDGDNSIRIVGDILARYVYWIEGDNKKNIPMECLAFDRNLEKFTNIEKDWVKAYYPDVKCGWAYATQAITSDGKIKVVNLKKKLWQQILVAAEDLGDPTDIETGWDIKFKKVKTGPLAYNVEYSLQVLKCKPRPLTPEEREILKDLKSMDEVMPRPTPELQKEFLDRLRGGATSTANADEEAIEAEFNVG